MVSINDPEDSDFLVKIVHGSPASTALAPSPLGSVKMVVTALADRFTASTYAVPFTTRVMHSTVVFDDFTRLAGGASIPRTISR